MRKSIYQYFAAAAVAITAFVGFGSQAKAKTVSPEDRITYVSVTELPYCKGQGLSQTKWQGRNACYDDRSGWGTMYIQNTAKVQQAVVRHNAGSATVVKIEKTQRVVAAAPAAQFFSREQAVAYKKLHSPLNPRECGPSWNIDNPGASAFVGAVRGFSPVDLAGRPIQFIAEGLGFYSGALEIARERACFEYKASGENKFRMAYWDGYAVGAVGRTAAITVATGGSLTVASMGPTVAFAAAGRAADRIPGPSSRPLRQGISVASNIRTIVVNAGVLNAKHPSVRGMTFFDSAIASLVGRFATDMQVKTPHRDVAGKTTILHRRAHNPRSMPVVS
jgi:hypothetical protein